MLSVEEKEEYGTQLKVRVPETLREELKGLCKVRGLKVQEFVRNAIEDAMAKERRVSRG